MFSGHRIFGRRAGRRVHRLPGLCLAAALVLPLAACGSGEDDPAAADDAGGSVTTAAMESDPGPVSGEEPLLIAATTTILGDIVTNIAGGDARVTVLLPVGADPHDYRASATQVALLHDADLVVVNGLMLEEGLIDVLAAAEADGARLFEVGELLDPLPFAGTPHEGEEDHDEGEDGHDHEGEEAHDEGEEDHDEGEDGHDHEGEEAHDEGEEDHDEGEDGHDHEGEEAHDEGEEDHDEGEDGHDHEGEEAHDEGEEDHDEGEDGHDHEGEEAHDEGEDGHDHGGEDPHFWMDPLRAAQAALLIAEELAGIAPSFPWMERAEAYAASLEELDAEIRALLSPIPEENRKLVTNHDSLGYFAHRYGFDVIATVIPGGATLAEPSSADLAALVHTIEEEEVRAVFAETIEPTALAEAVAAEADSPLRVVELYTGSLGGPGSGADTLIGMLRTNAIRIAEALSG